MEDLDRRLDELRRRVVADRETLDALRRLRRLADEHARRVRERVDALVAGLGDHTASVTSGGLSASPASRAQDASADAHAPAVAASTAAAAAVAAGASES